MNHYLLVLQSVVLPATMVMGSAVHYGQHTNMEAIVEKQKVETAVKYNVETKTVDREAVLEKFFDKYSSPLKGHADTFVKVADKYGMDYRLLPAISCQESSCGKKLIPGTYNPFGWGIYGSHYIAFKDYDEAIETVGKGMKDNYISRGFDTPEKIEPIYTPPSHGHWMSGVNYFMKEMNKISESTPSKE